MLEYVIKRFRNLCYKEWFFEKQLMKEKFSVDLSITQDLNPGGRFD